jgi:hypothetical protein
MGNSTQLEPWIDVVRRFRDEWQASDLRVYDRSLPGGASDEELGVLLHGAAERKLHVDDDYVAMLKVINGSAFDGLVFGGAAIAPGDAHGRVDFLWLNDQFSANFPESDGMFTIYGTWDTDIYRYDHAASAFQVVDRGGGDVMSAYATFGELAEYAFGQRL